MIDKGHFILIYPGKVQMDRALCYLPYLLLKSVFSCFVSFCENSSVFVTARLSSAEAFVIFPYCDLRFWNVRRCRKGISRSAECSYS